MHMPNKYQVICKYRFGEGEERVKEGLERSDCWMLGSQESVGELNGFVEIIVVVIAACRELSKTLFLSSCSCSEFLLV